MTLTIGLTGDIACGKSTVCKMLAELGAELIDADKVAHQLMAPGSEAYRRIVGEFGRDILTSSGEIDRAALAGKVFDNPPALTRLEAILHPLVGETVSEMIARSKAEVVVVEAVKLVESGMYRDYGSLWVVTCRREQQLERMMRDRGMTREAAVARLGAQPPLAEKLRWADVVIDNSGSVADTRRQVIDGWRRTIGHPRSRPTS